HFYNLGTPHVNANKTLSPLLLLNLSLLLLLFTTSYALDSAGHHAEPGTAHARVLADATGGAGAGAGHVHQEAEREDRVAGAPVAAAGNVHAHRVDIVPRVPCAIVIFAPPTHLRRPPAKLRRAAHPGASQFAFGASSSTQPQHAHAPPASGHKHQRSSSFGQKRPTGPLFRNLHDPFPELSRPKTSDGLRVAPGELPLSRGREGQVTLKLVQGAWVRTPAGEETETEAETETETDTGNDTETDGGNETETEEGMTATASSVDHSFDHADIHGRFAQLGELEDLSDSDDEGTLEGEVHVAARVRMPEVNLAKFKSRESLAMRLEFGHNCASAPTLSRRTRTWASSSSRPCPSAFTSRARLGGFFIRPPHPFNTGIDMDSKETSPLIPNHSFERSVLASRLYGKVFFNWILHNEPLKEHIEAWTGVPLLVSTPAGTLQAAKYFFTFSKSIIGSSSRSSTSVFVRTSASRPFK
ncbi:hypothetical protein FIBSPDRAFT_967092, partial [Athelia psychrophila]